MTAHPYHKKLARVLDRMGGLYGLNDILTAIAEGRMQGFVEGNSWAITQVVSFPRAKVLQILAVVGDLNDCRVLHDEIIEYAKRNGIGLITAYGRRGWMPDAKKHDWKVKTISYLYHREL